MHQDDVHVEPGSCSICEMEIVPAESLPGLVSAESMGNPLLIPKTAVLKTGERSVVYVRSRQNDEVSFEGREITLGPKAGEEYVVIDGLKEGEEVVVNGAFKIDSALQIEAKPSMMSPQDSESTAKEKVESIPLSHKQYEELLPIYLQLQESLAADNFASAKKAIGKIKDSNDNIFGIEIEGSIKKLRAAFELISVSMIANAAKHHHGSELHEVFCPMAFENKGASWLQSTIKVANPYYGSTMLRCGSVTNSYGVHHGK